MYIGYGRERVDSDERMGLRSATLSVTQNGYLRTQTEGHALMYNYYKYTGGLESMARTESVLKSRLPESIGILPNGILLFIPSSMWRGDDGLRGLVHPTFEFEKAERYDAKDHVVIRLEGETIADVSGRSRYYEGFEGCVDKPPECEVWVEPTKFGMMFIPIFDMGMTEEEARKIGVLPNKTWRRVGGRKHWY